MRIRDNHYKCITRFFIFSSNAPIHQKNSYRL